MWKLPDEKTIHEFQNALDEETLKFLAEMEAPSVLPPLMPWFETEEPHFELVCNSFCIWFKFLNF